MTDRTYSHDHIDGRRVPQLVVREDHIIRGAHHGTVHVERGTLTLIGELHGTLDVQSGARVEVVGEQHGTVAVARDAVVRVTGALHGTVDIRPGGEVRVEAGAKMGGTLQNDGLVVLRGTYGGKRSGNGEFRIEGGTVKQPSVVNGIEIYRW